MRQMTSQTQDLKALNSISEKVIGFAYKVHNKLGRRFLEKVYENALVHELLNNHIDGRQQERLVVTYDEIIVGDFLVDLIAGGALLVEIKAVADISKSHEAQLFNYLKASGLRLGLILNFGSNSVQIKRRVMGY